MRQRVVAAALLLALTGGVAALASTGRDDGGYAPRIDPAEFTPTITNPYLPLRPGNRWIYEGRTEDGFERKVVEVTDLTPSRATCRPHRDVETLLELIIGTYGHRPAGPKPVRRKAYNKWRRDRPLHWDGPSALLVVCTGSPSGRLLVELPQREAPRPACQIRCLI
jgi:hypothetical protein